MNFIILLTTLPLAIYFNDRRIQIYYDTELSTRERVWKTAWSALNMGFVWFFFLDTYDEILISFGWATFCYKLVAFSILITFFFYYKKISGRPILNSKF